ncbi:MULTISPECIES: hypothetical protein [Streptomyces]|uniref:Uncharacterized protein n=1 Tax=Streptomyces prunicolor TaxID=67348 RepID=A0ABU4FF46_9ACTN|nr:hypothetical protein [Streptomyces prunicolor]MDV7219213.1 hypothetical protein [Streptomyces prunicolor]WSX58319.1 hypothetical protein OG504_18630 [Streptomyces sp. NBC_00986]
MEQLPESVDRDILEHRIIAAIATIRETLGCTIHQAIDVFAERYEGLRRDRPDDFDLSRDEYGRGFYS